MIEISKHEALEIRFNEKHSATLDFNGWLEKVSVFLFDIAQVMPLSLFSINPDKKRCIGYDIGKVVEEDKRHGYRYVLTSLDGIDYNTYKTVVESDEFYLGFVILVAGTVDDQVIDNLILNYKNTFFLSKTSLFRMDTDGYCFYIQKTSNFAKPLAYYFGY